MTVKNCHYQEIEVGKGKNRKKTHKKSMSHMLMHLNFQKYQTVQDSLDLKIKKYFHY